MRWPWTKRKDASRRKASADIAAVQRSLDDAHAAEAMVHDLVRKLALIRERNNFAASIEAAFRERR